MSTLKRWIKIWGLLPIVAIAALMVLSACSGQAQQPATQPTIPPMQTAGSENTQAPVAEATATVAPIPTETAAAVPVSFSKDVLPILMSRCLNCHGGQKTEKGFNITSYESVMAGSHEGPAVVPGDAAHSRMIELVQLGKMPKRGPKVLPDQLQILIDWIQAGALNN